MYKTDKVIFITTKISGRELMAGFKLKKATRTNPNSATFTLSSEVKGWLLKMFDS